MSAAGDVAGDGQDRETPAGDVAPGGTGAEARSRGEVVLEVRHAVKSFGAVRALVEDYLAAGTPLRCGAAGGDIAGWGLAILTIASHVTSSTHRAPY